LFLFLFLSTKFIFLLEEEQPTTTTTRQAKSKAIEALSISNHKRRIEADSDLNEDQEDNKKRTSSLSHRSIPHVSNTIRSRKRSETLSNTKTFKRQRQSSSEEEDNQLSIRSKPKRNSAPILPHYNRRKKSDSEQQSESTDTGNLCVRRRTGKQHKKTRYLLFLKYQIK
jgi:hypothetical protein